MPKDLRREYETRATDTGWAEFQFKKWISSDEWVSSGEEWAEGYYYPVYYIEPFGGNESEPGKDLGSNPKYVELMNRSRNTGTPVASPGFRLVDEEGNRVGFMIFAPIFGTGGKRETVAQRSQSLMGYSVGIFSVSDIVQESLAGKNYDFIRIRITDESLREGERLLFDSAPDSVIPRESALQHSRLYDVGGRQWKFQYIAIPE